MILSTALSRSLSCFAVMSFSPSHWLVLTLAAQLTTVNYIPAPCSGRSHLPADSTFLHPVAEAQQRTGTGHSESTREVTQRHARMRGQKAGHLIEPAWHLVPSSTHCL